jgi:N-acyl-D-aspartate/D-glutamate deacylase
MHDTGAGSLSRRQALRRLTGIAVGISPLGALARGLAAQSGAARPAGPTTPITGVRSAALRIAINGGRAFVDGALRPLSVGVTADGRLRVSDRALPADTVIDATGRVVSPGFIDVLGDNSSNPAATYRIYESFKLGDGVTTALQMHGGASDVATFRRQFEPLPHYVNYGVSTKVMNLRNGYRDHATRLRKIEECLDRGSLGVSHSIEYQASTTYGELLDYARLARRYDRPFFLHLRHSSPRQELDGVREAAQLALDTGARLHIAHLHSTGGTYNMPAALAVIRLARSAGAEITCCVYPYSYWATYLHSQRFDGGWRERYGLDYGDLTVVGTGERLTAASFARYRKRAGVLVAVPEGTMPLEHTVDLALREDFCLVGSDGGIERESRANSHPRGAGCFATALRHGQDAGIGLERVLSAMTARPAALARLPRRGAIRDGYIADLTVFDPRAVRGLATAANPNQRSAGIEAVVVNGELAYRPGHPMRMEGVGLFAQPPVVAMAGPAGQGLRAR